MGLYVGGGLEKADAATTVADEVPSFINSEGAFDQIAIQYCGATSNYFVGLAISTDNDLPAVQELVNIWSLNGFVTGFNSKR